MTMSWYCCRCVKAEPTNRNYDDALAQAKLTNQLSMATVWQTDRNGQVWQNKAGKIKNQGQSGDGGYSNLAAT